MESKNSPGTGLPAPFGNHKAKWESLATEKDMEAKYIYTDGDLDFRESGKRDYENLIKNDIHIKQFLKPYNNKVALEIGCGTGRMTEFIAGDFKKVYALDISRTMIEAGARRLSHLKNIEWVETDGMHLPKALQVDLIFSYIVFQHCPKWMVESNLESAIKILQNAGIMKIQVRGQVIRQDRWYSGDWYTIKEIEETLEGIGFEIVDTWHDPEERRYLWVWSI